MRLGLVGQQQAADPRALTAQRQRGLRPLVGALGIVTFSVGFGCLGARRTQSGDVATPLCVRPSTPLVDAHA